MFDSVSGVGCLEQPVTPFERTTGDGDDESDVGHTHGPRDQFADSYNNRPVFSVEVEEVNAYILWQRKHRSMLWNSIVYVKLSPAELPVWSFGSGIYVLMVLLLKRQC